MYNEGMRWFLFVRQPVFTIGQFNRLSNIFDNAGQVVFAVVVLAPVASGFDKINWFVIASGVVGIIFSWMASIWFARKGENI